MADILSSTYLMIPSEVTEDLTEAVRYAGQQLLDTLWKNTGAEGEAPAAGSKETADVLAPRILTYFREHLASMDPGRLELMSKVAQSEQMKNKEIQRVIFELLPYGMVVAFQVNDQCHFLVPRQIWEILQASLRDPDLQTEMRVYRVFRNVVRACLTLYGVFTRRELMAVYVSCAAAPGESREKSRQMVEAIWSFLPVLQEEGWLVLEENRVHIRLFTDEVFKICMESREPFSLYVPERNLSENYMNGLYAEKNPEYMTLSRFLMVKRDSQLKKEEMLEAAAKMACQEDAEPMDVLGFLSRYVTLPANQKAAERLTQVLDAWLLTVRRWPLYGHNRKEVGIVNQMKVDPAAVLGAKTVQTGSAAKIYPNAPCPCGSGKKYKHCCGKKRG